MSVCLLLPLKSLRQGKTRLAPVLDASRRRALIERLLSHVLDQAAVFPGLQHTILVSPCASARARAEQRGARALDEQMPGLNHAMGCAVTSARALSYNKTMVVPCDLPRLHFDDLLSLADHASERAVALAPDASGRGTNGICLPAAVDFPFAFGEDSFALHLAAIRRLGLQVAQVQRAGLAFDVDTPADLRHLHSLESALLSR